MIIFLVLFLQVAFPDWMIVAPRLQAKSNLALGDAAYATCMAGPTADSTFCQTERGKAIRSDIEIRFNNFFKDLGAGRITDAHSLDVYLSYYQFRLISATTIPTPFGPIPAGPPPNPAPNPFPH